MSRTNKAAAEKRLPAELAASKRLSPSPKSISTLAVGKLRGLRGTSVAIISCDGMPTTPLRRARVATTLGQGDIGRDVVICFENGDSRQPLVIGVLGSWSPEESARAAPPARDLVLDGERLLLTAQQEIILTCGKSSLILTRAGKVIIRGTYLSSRSSGVHRVKGGSVQIN